jgi:hypothetical protein
LSSLASWLGSADRRLLAAIAALVVLVLSGGTVGAVFAYQQTLPTTVTFNLKAGQKEVPLDQRVTVTFSRPASPGAVASHLHLSPTTEGALAPSPDRRSFTWMANGPWADLTTYTVKVDPFKDGGHDVQARTLTFTTTIVPRVTTVTTDSGAGVADAADIPAGTKLVLNFNAPMNQPSVQLQVNGSASNLAWGQDGKSATLDTKGMKIGPLSLAFAPGGKDTAGHAMSADWKLGLNLVFKVNVHTTPLRFPALVQVPNDPLARDQSGLQSADMVFEYATEGNIPRFTAIFTNVPDKVGPIRSGRLISIKLTQHYKGQLYLSGTSEGTFGVLQRSGIPAFFDTQGFYYRSFDRPAPNNLYINGDAIARAENSGIPAFKMTTGKPSIPAGPGGTQVQVAQNGSTYNYDDGTKTYTKSEDGHTFADASIGQPLRIAMLIVMHTRVTVTGIIEDSNGAHGLDYDLDSGGTAEIYYNGQKATGRWSGPAGSPLVFTLDNGTQVALPAGLVWVDVVP